MKPISTTELTNDAVQQFSRPILYCYLATTTQEIHTCSDGISETLCMICRVVSGTSCQRLSPVTNLYHIQLIIIDTSTDKSNINTNNKAEAISRI